MIARAHAEPLRNQQSASSSKARVVIVQDPDVMNDDLRPLPEEVHAMLDRGLSALLRQTNVQSAWKSLVSTNDVIGIKVVTEPGPVSGTRRAVVAAVVQDLLAIGVPANKIVVWDRRASDLRAAGYFELKRQFGIRVQGSVESGYDDKKFYETPLLGSMAAEDVDFNRIGPGIGRKSYVSKLVTKELTKIINITPMLHHNVVGVSGDLLSLALGSVDNIGRFEGKPEDLSRAVPEILSLPLRSDDDRLGDHVVLNIVDALICQYEGQDYGLLHYSTVLDQLRLSRDPVALDILSLQEINYQRQHAQDPLNQTNVDLYSNASLMELGVSNPNNIQVEKIR